MKDIYEKRAYNDFDDNGKLYCIYSSSDINEYLNDSFINLFNNKVQTSIKTIKIPFTNGTGTEGVIASGSSGLSVKIFLLSYAEVGFEYSASANIEGSVLSYFNGATNAKRIAYYEGTAFQWWTRTPSKSSDQQGWVVNISGAAMSNLVTVANYPFGIRPALILPSTHLIDSSFNVIT